MLPHGYERGQTSKLLPAFLYFGKCLHAASHFLLYKNLDIKDNISNKVQLASQKSKSAALTIYNDSHISGLRLQLQKMVHIVIQHFFPPIR